MDNPEDQKLGRGSGGGIVPGAPSMEGWRMTGSAFKRWTLWGRSGGLKEQREGVRGRERGLAIADCAGAGGFLLEVFFRSWAVLGRSWSGLGPSWAVLGLSWSFLGRSWVILDRSWAVLGRSWASLGALFAALGASWGGLGPSWGGLGASWGVLVRSWGGWRAQKRQFS